MTRRLAVVGLGGMGGGVAARLAESGFPLVVHNRTAAKAADAVAAGAVLAGSAAEAAEGAEVVLLSLADEDAVEEVLFGQIAPVLKPDTVVVEMSTLSPSYSRSAQERLAALGVRRVEACLIGNPPMARAGQVRVFASGDQADVDDLADVFAAFAGGGVRHLGPTGRAGALKLAFNLLLGVQTAGLADAVAFAERSGIDRGVLLDALAQSGWRSPVLHFRGEFMRTGQYRPAGFRARLMAKDMDLAVREAAAGDLALPMTSGAAARFAEAVAAGRGDDDAAVVAELFPRTTAGTQKKGTDR
ncbi:NAD(P)-dependent oxidoreductase [Amycolatopsis sp. NPDC021455]|uniref:NAD(P)-dependent oxidoreductase n=1 Tax=Amycolatopsis sp. NPDC021455 TaxID=3154901 RepID=UPI0033DF9524